MVPTQRQPWKRIYGVPAVATAVFLIVAFLMWPRGQSGYVASANEFVLPALGHSGDVRLSDYRGKPVVVDLFASWCTACQAELPALASASHQLSGRVIFVGVDSEDTGPGLAMAQRYGISGWPLAADTGAGQGDYHDSLGSPGMPVTAFYGADGSLKGVVKTSLTATELEDKLRQYFGISLPAR